MSPSTASSLLPLAVALPLSGGVLAPLLGRLSGRLALVVAMATTVGAAGVLVAIAPSTLHGRLLVHFMGGWRPMGGNALGISFSVDPFGMVVATMTAAVGSVLLLYALSELQALGRRELGGFTGLFLFLLAGTIGSALTGDAFNLFVWFEVAALASYALTAFYLERPGALEASFKILVLTSLAGFLVFMGSALLYQSHAALNLAQLHRAMAPGLAATDLVAVALLVTGFGTKAGLVPFHAWLPDAHSAAPSAVSALFSGLMVNIGVVALARYALQVLPHDHVPVLGLLTGLGLASALVGCVLALVSDDLKRLLAWDTVSQVGVIFVALGTGERSGIAGAAYHLANHALFKPLLFLCAGAIVHTTGLTKLSEMGGIARRRPFLAVLFIAGVAALVGLPPLNGYASLLLIHEGVKAADGPVVFALLLLVEVVTAAALARAAWLAFFGPERNPSEVPDDPRALAPGMVAAISLLAAGCVAFGVLAGRIVRSIVAPAADGLTHATAYADAVLGPRGAALANPPLELHLFAASELGTALAVVLVGLGLAVVAVRWRERPPSPLRALQLVHTGSVNDYASFAVCGMLLAAVVLRLGRS